MFVACLLDLVDSPLLAREFNREPHQERQRAAVSCLSCIVLLCGRVVLKDIATNEVLRSLKSKRRAKEAYSRQEGRLFSVLECCGE